MSQIVNITTASKLTGLSIYALRKGAKEGRLPHLRMRANGKILYDLQLLAQTLATEAMSKVKSKEV